MTEVHGPNITPPATNVSKLEDDDDDFEKQLASFIEDEEKKDKDKEERGEIIIKKEKGEEDKLEKEQAGDKDDDYTFTNDQRRAMDELLAQREEDDFIGEEEPPEYNVKERLLQLNAELANDPTPLDSDSRDVRIKFKDNLVDLVAPPPDFSDEEAEPTVSLKSLQKHKENSDNKLNSSNNTNSPRNKKCVVEREGKFEVLSADEMTPIERELYIHEDTENTPPNKNTRIKQTNRNNSNTANQTKQPTPPSKPRPATATINSPRRNVRPSSSKPRPKSASVTLNNSSGLENFDYHSPYALPDDVKNQFKQRAKYLEEKKRQEEQERKEHEREKAETAESMFQAWLEKKKEEQRQKRKEEHEKKKNEEKEDKSNNGEKVNNSDSDWSEISDQAKENEAIFNQWMKHKQSQQKKEKLLKRRQQQEMKEGFVVHNREDCEKNFRRWLRRKNAEIRRKKNAERQKMRYLRLASRKSRKSQALARAINQSQSYKYVDYNY
ncbi:hypothetical protein LOTGIDRAFT_229064 [Lottia gigantea]|uniref:Coiled-coil domain-containing protein 181 n=1 Tax=Lottia gigantea TaxID=225164 RepID=V4BKP2_LOTGI|nr:hypothetical protein LOTGIDRAFT_229064 [Lottia gigantea]ESO89154.1 hypothetical protein LOTGIDRAFT_229064 [Lottia gigantea]